MINVTRMIALDECPTTDIQVVVMTDFLTPYLRVEKTQ
jgi:hypothetical protein